MIYVVIPVHNRKSFTLACIESLMNQTVAGFVIIVIDDGSTDGTEAAIKESFPEVIIIKGDGTLWWSGATNLGVRYALEHNADYILTLNNDTLAPPNYIEKMLYWAKRQPKSIIGSMAIDAESGEVIFAGERVNWKKAKYIPLHDYQEPGCSTGLHEVSHLPGRGTLIPRMVFETVGYYDQEKMPQYAADFDLTHRAIRQGFSVFCNYDAKLKIFPQESGGKELRKTKSLRNFWIHLFGKKGAGNLKAFYYYARKNCPRKYFLHFFLIGAGRRVMGYIFH